MSSTLRRITMLVAVVVLLACLVPGVAYASLDSSPSPVGTTLTNPNPSPADGSYIEDWWRMGWGNSLTPQMTWNPPEGLAVATDGLILGQLYQVDRDSSLTIVSTTPWLYSIDTFGNTNGAAFGTNFDTTYDLLGVYANGAGSWPPMETGATNVMEGTWWVHAMYFSTLRYSTKTMHVPFKIDITPPNPVAGLEVATGVGKPPIETATWVPTTRAHITWNPGTYDSLSGVAYYKFLLDEVEVDSAVQGRVYEVPGLPTPSSWTIENMPPGQHKISVVAVDRATNESTSTSVYFYSDPDTPTVAFTSAGGYINSRSVVSVDASDKAGDPTVVFTFDGVTTATVSAPPYSFTPQLSGVSAGSHVIVATATDHMGRHVSATQTVLTIAASGFQLDDTGGLDGPTSGVSATHPNADDAAWRQGWGNSLRPQFTITLPSVETSMIGNVIGMLYTVDKNPFTRIDIAHPELYFRSAHGAGTDLDETVDLMSIVSHPPVGGWPIPLPGEASATEGRWYMHFTMFTDQGYAGMSTHAVQIGMDLTPPRAVENLQASPTNNAADGGSWTAATRAHLTWTPKSYDDLSGVAYYQIYIDGDPVSPSADGRVWEVEGRTPSSFTIENMPPGRHRLSVAAVDRATNEGPLTSAYFYSDPDTPTVAFTSAGGYINSRSVVSVDASDKAGDPTVVFTFDGVTTATVSAPPYSFTPQLSGVSAGSHVIVATATDHMGRHASATQTVSTTSATSGFQPDDTGGLDGPESGVSATHPNADDAAWRQGWGNSIRPQFTITLPSVETSMIGNVIGMLYTVDKNPLTQIDIAHPGLYFRSAHGAGTDLDETVDLMSIVSHPPVGGWPAPLLGEASITEGRWYMHWSMFTDQGYAGTRTHAVQIGMDLTPPRAVENLRVSPTTNAADGGSWTTATRAHLTWTPKSYDDLSGVAYFQIYMDGDPVSPGADGRVWEVEGRTPSSFTIENMPPGRHRLSISAVDRATNEGPLTSAYFYSDPDVPTVKFRSFAHTVGIRPTFSVTTSDAAGIREVVYRLDGNVLGRRTVSPYSITPYLGGYSNGTHTLTATAVDMLGRTAVATTTITLNKTPLLLSSFRRTPSIFYPIIHDGYRDYSYLTFKLNRAAKVVLAVKNSKGKTIRTIKRSCVAGTNKMTWDGKYASDQSAHVGTFTYQLTATDSLGNIVKSVKLTTTIRNYQLVRTSSNSVKVIPR